MKSRIIVVISTFIIIVLLTLVFINKEDKDISDVYETGLSESETSLDRYEFIEREYEEGELEAIEENFSNITRDDEVADTDEYNNSNTNNSSFEILEGSVVSDEIIKYLTDNGYQNGTLSSNPNGPMLLDGTTEFYTDALMFIRDSYPDWSDEYYFYFVSSDMSESFYLIELYNEVIRVDFEF